MKSLLRFAMGASLAVSSLFAMTQSAAAAPAAPEAVWQVDVQATPNGLRVVVLNDDNDGSGWPGVWYRLEGSSVFVPLPYVWATYLGGNFWLDYYYLETSLECGAEIEVLVNDSPAPLWSGTFKVTCESLGSIRGTAYKDGAIYTGAWYKITDGGNWYVCGTVGGDGTFGVPVKAGTYYVIPLDQPGLRASGIMKVVVEAGKASLGNDIKYTSDPSAKHEPCDAYNPPKPIPPELRK